MIKMNASLTKQTPINQAKSSRVSTPTTSSPTRSTWTTSSMCQRMRERTATT